jgi:hypothetical protein
MKIIHYPTKPTEDSKFLREVMESNLLTYAVKDQIFVVKSRLSRHNVFLSKEEYKKLVLANVDEAFRPVEEIIKSEKII